MHLHHWILLSRYQHIVLRLIQLPRMTFFVMHFPYSNAFQKTPPLAEKKRRIYFYSIEETTVFVLPLGVEYRYLPNHFLQMKHPSIDFRHPNFCDTAHFQNSSLHRIRHPILLHELDCWYALLVYQHDHLL